MKIAITGGIGAGKSYVCQMLQERGISIFNCDTEAKRIIATHPEVRQELTALLGGKPLTRESLAAYLHSSHDAAARVGAIVHPRVAEAFVESQQQWMECAILLESGFDRLVDRIIVVTCPIEERLRRIIQRDHCDRATAQKWIELQTSDEERLRHAHYHIVNDGTTPLEPQLDSIMQTL